MRDYDRCRVLLDALLIDLASSASLSLSVVPPLERAHAAALGDGESSTCPLAHLAPRPSQSPSASTAVSTSSAPLVVLVSELDLDGVGVRRAAVE
jgi:hypothetical protein